MSKLITMDIGSFNIKLNNGDIHENRFLLDNETDIFGHEAIKFENNVYFFGKGQFDRKITKAKKNIEVPLLYGLGKAGVAGNINLILHLPANQMPMKSEIIDRLQGKTLSFELNGQANSVTFDKVGILKEGFSSFYALHKRSTGLVAIIDIGGRTTDIFTFSEGREEVESSLPVGTMDYFSDIADNLSGKGEPRVMEEIHKLINNDLIDLKDFEPITDKIFNTMLNSITMKFPNLNDYSIKLCGGGADYFESRFKKVFKKVSQVTNTLTSNVDGAEKIGKAKGLDK